MGWIYQAAHAVAFVAALPWYALTRGGATKYRQVLGPRFGHPPLEAPEGSIWIQAVSVGEAGVAEILAKPLRSATGNRPLLVTTTTVTGQQRAKALFPADRVGYFPFDFTPVVARAVDRIRPAIFVMIETEIWPGMIEALSRRKIPIALANARISDRSFPRYRAARLFLGPTLSRIDRVFASSPLDAERLEAIGVEGGRIEVTGNLKFDRNAPTSPLPWEDDRRRLFGDRPFFVAGSTTDGEEALVLEAFHLASDGGKRGGLVLAPRHPERFPLVADLLRSTGLRFARRSGFEPAGRPADRQGEIDVLLLDTLGELGRAYQGARGAFVGGSLVPKGGHNPIEPSLFGVPVAVGPHTSNFRDIGANLAEAGGLEEVEGATTLAALWSAWLDRPEEAASIGEKGRRLVEESRGAAERTARGIARLIR
jgi:3-deoxy-D-manno-octulosonic-acid transferase